MKIKIAELTGHALDWVVADCEGYTAHSYLRNAYICKDANGRTMGIQVPTNRAYVWYAPSRDWAQGGPIMQRCKYSFCSRSGPTKRLFVVHNQYNDGGKVPYLAYADQSLLVAYMRCYVANELGDEIEIPDELINVDQHIDKAISKAKKEQYVKETRAANYAASSKLEK